MQNNVTIKEVSLNEYRVSGTVLTLKDCSKNVLVGGQVYTHTKFEEAQIDLDKEWGKEDKSNWRKYETDFLHYFLKPEVSMWGYSNAHSFIQSNYYKSENDYICFLQILSEKKLIPIPLYCGRYEHSWYDMVMLRKNIEIDFILCEYGFNNKVWTSVKYTEYLKLNLPKNQLCLTRWVEDFFPENINVMKQEQKSELLIRFINNLNHETNSVT